MKAWFVLPIVIMIVAPASAHAQAAAPEAARARAGKARTAALAAWPHEASTVSLHLQITRFTEGGYLARAARPVDQVNPRTGATTSQPGPWLASPVFIYSKGGNQGVGSTSYANLYPAGTRQYRNALGVKKTGPAYALTWEHAAAAARRPSPSSAPAS